MTGLEIMAIASALQAGGKMVKGGLDWLDGGKASASEMARMNKLRAKIKEKAISNADVQRAEQFGARQATSTMSEAVNTARSGMAFQGMGSSGIANQIGLKEGQALADAQISEGIGLRERQTNVNRQVREQREAQLDNMKMQLANRRKAVKAQGAQNFLSGGMDMITLGAQQKMTGEGIKTPPPKETVPKVEGYGTGNVNDVLVGRKYIDTGSDIDKKDN